MPARTSGRIFGFVFCLICSVFFFLIVEQLIFVCLGFLRANFLLKVSMHHQPSIKEQFSPAQWATEKFILFS